jgi:hypothetical protein
MIFIHTHSCSLNKTIKMLNVAIVPNTTVIIYHRQFAYSESFIVQVSWDVFLTKAYPDYNNNIMFLLWQYYKLLFNYNVR